MRANVTWCRRAITPRFPHFRFQHADLFNTEYNPRGRLRAEAFRFPYPDGAFDFAFLTSVFTHLPPATAAHYLAEVDRVLRPGGRCLATFFLLNPESERLVDAGCGTFPLHPGVGPCRAMNPAVPEACLALDEQFVRTAAETAGLRWPSREQYGNWCGRADGYDYQDIVVFERADSGAPPAPDAAPG